MVGSESTLGDKCSVKRSVIGRGCSLGSGVKIINSVLMDGVQVGDNCHIQNSIVCKVCVLQAGAQIKDCQLGPGYVVPAGCDHKAEVLANGKKI
jgi:translation initiation factor eIF-2B subunit gamma